MVTVEVARTERQTLNIEDVARRLGINRTTAYELARRDQLPIPTIRIGRRLVVSRSALDDLLNRRKENEDGGEAA